ncbi:hypothetical protein ACFYPF_03400 [Micromonospora sp. NPDC005223]|uniref:hypothetical protein n=1 Tax=unclassified Micromonospora TaxID=2617518 RepID=UPI0033E41D11
MPTSEHSKRHPLSNVHRIYQHLPMRPLWLCRVCAAPWPCATARMLLRHEYRQDRVSLSVYMSSCLFDATGDLLALNPNPGPQPGELFDRFLAWTAPKPGG